MGRPTRDTCRDLPVEKHLLHKKKKGKQCKNNGFRFRPAPALQVHGRFSHQASVTLVDREILEPEEESPEEFVGRVLSTPDVRIAPMKMIATTFRSCRTL